jgi:DNA-binding IscR family transcriptional regulator
VRAGRGHHGGFTLARPPERIRLGDVLAAVGGTLERDLCVFGAGRCDPDRPCPLHDSWSRLNAAFHDWSRRTTLGTIAGRAGGRAAAGAAAPRRARKRGAGTGA